MLPRASAPPALPNGNAHAERSELRVIVAQIGARHNYAVARALRDEGCLSALYTDFCLYGWRARAVAWMLNGRQTYAGALRRRTVTGVPAGRIRSAPEVSYWPAVRRLKGHAVYQYQDELFGRAMLRWGFGDANVVYAMFGNGQAFLEQARERGLKIAVDVFITPIAHRIEHAERERFPDWELPLPADLAYFEPIEEKVRRVIRVADLLVCPAESVADGLAAYDETNLSKAALLPYANTASYGRPSMPESGRVFFAGTASLRKGIHYLAFAANVLREGGRGYSFAVAGGVAERIRRHPMARNLNFLGHLAQEPMRDEFLRADVFVLPTLAEGSASVIFEALAAGVPVVTTRSAGSVVTDGVEGFIVPERDIDALAKAVERIVEDRELRARMSAAAFQKAQEYTLARWGERLVDTLQAHFGTGR